ncbi:MAG: hypothetical protein HUJ83_10980, partial [Veillonella sp.]|nr:hypothetical protein [Veillonella sp.]
MVLRDPPGTGSHAEWTSGYVKTTTTTLGGIWSLDESYKLTALLGSNTETVTGVGLASITSLEATANFITGLQVVDEGENANTTTSTYTITSTISTSDAPEYVGSMGDVYIGRSTNITFGRARQISLTREGTMADPEITKQDVTTVGTNFGTIFNYTQNYIENVLIPNYQAMLEEKLITIDEREIEKFINHTDYPVYLTPHKPGDENFGKANYEGDEYKKAIQDKLPLSSGPNYWMKEPYLSQESYTDSVAWIINQIEAWENAIAANERDKVEAFYKQNQKHFIENVSFDSGTKRSYTQQNDDGTGTSVENTIKAVVTLGGVFGSSINKTGILNEIITVNGGGAHTVESTDSTSTAIFMYEFAEDGDDDALSVDVLTSPAKWSPIFHTRAGQTCGPYEGKEETKYFEPGQYVLNEATMQIEVPKITVEVPVVSDVPTGSAANFNLLLTNESEIDEDVYYKLLVIDETNADGAALKIDGQPLTEGRRIKIPAGETVKKLLQLSQSDISILDYENIGIVLGSETQYDPTSTWDQIADTVFISAHFVPSSSEVTLHIDSPILNTALGDNLALSFDNFDRNFQGL